MTDNLIIQDNKIIINQNVRSQLIEYQKQKAKMELLEKTLKEEIKEKLESNEAYELADEIISAKLTKASTRTTVDSKKLKEELPEVFEAYSKTSNVSSSISLSYDL